jgi:hypothetical protein
MNIEKHAGSGMKGTLECLARIMPRRTFLAIIEAPQKEENNGLTAQRCGVRRAALKRRDERGRMKAE